MLVGLVKGMINLFFYFTFSFVIFLLVKQYLIQPFQVEGISMEPTLKDGYQMILDKVQPIERFDIIAFPDPSGSDQHYIKRLIGLPGDQIEMVEDVLYLNGYPLDEPYLSSELTSDPSTEYTENFTLQSIIGQDRIPAGYYFVMGDNRPNSGDSRQFGLVPISSVEGRSQWVYYPFSDFGQVTQYNLSEDKRTIMTKMN